MAFGCTAWEKWKAIVTAYGGTPVIPAGTHYNDAVLSLIEQAITAAGGAVPARAGLDWNSRHLQLLDTLASLSPAGSADLDTLDAHLSSGTWTDPGGNHLSGTPSFSDGAWTVSLLGGAGTSVSDPFDGAHLIGSEITTLDSGETFTAAAMWAILLHLLEISPPASLSSDIVITMGLCTESADSATMDAIGIGITYTGGSRTLHRSRVQNGVVQNISGSPNANIRAHENAVVKLGNGTSNNVHWCSVSSARALDANGEALTAVGAGSATDIVAVQASTARPRPFLAVFRSSTSDGTTRSVTFKPRRGPISAPLILTS